MKTILVVDGNNLMHRCFWAVRGLTTKDGHDTGAIYGFIKSLLSVSIKFHLRNIIVVFDGRGDTWRHRLAHIYKMKGVVSVGYKERRKDEKYRETWKKLSPQFDDARDFLKCAGIPVFERDGVEADDFVGNLCALFSSCKVRILSNDRDFYQLLSERVSMLIPLRGQGANYRFYRDKDFLEEYGIRPKQWIDVGALMGDAGDCIEGLKGIGIKRALSIVIKYKGVKCLLSNRNALYSSSEPVKKVLDNQLLVRLAYKLKRIKKKGIIEKDELKEILKTRKKMDIKNMRKMLDRLEIEDVNLGQVIYYLGKR